MRLFFIYFSHTYLESVIKLTGKSLFLLSICIIIIILIGVFYLDPIQGSSQSIDGAQAAANTTTQATSAAPAAANVTPQPTNDIAGIVRNVRAQIDDSEFHRIVG